MSKAESAKTENQITVANVGITIVVIKKLFYCSSFDILAMNIPVKVPMLTKSPVKYHQLL
jgi:hypothetical protein